MSDLASGSSVASEANLTVFSPLRGLVSGDDVVDLPFSSIEDRIVIGDAREILRAIPDNAVDLIHTSPPYNIEKNYAHTDDNLEHEIYLDLLHDVFAQSLRVLKPNCSLFFQTGYSQNGGDEIFPIDMLSYDMFRSIGFRLWDRIIWHYRGGMSFTRKFKNTHETILWWVKPDAAGRLQPKFDVDAVRERSRSYDKRNNLYGKNPGNVWSADRVAFGGKARDTTHIAVYPEIITERIIRACSKPSDMVLDPFAGSGTTPGMARALGRHWLGIEVSPTYADEAQSRIGRKQASEVGTVISGLIKVLAFHNRPGCKPLAFVHDTLRTWMRRLGIEAYEVLVEERLGPVFQGKLFDSRESKSEKPAAWRFFDDLLQQEDAIDEPLVLVSQILDASYPQRSKWNGVRKYIDSLTHLKHASHLCAEDIASVVDAALSSEPSAYETADDRSEVRFVGPSLSLSLGGMKRMSSPSVVREQGLLFGG